MKKAPSLSTLSRLWRKAILKKSRNVCIICGKYQPDHCLEAHHIIHRSQSGLLKWDVRNGVAVCKGRCHQVAGTKWGEKAIAEKIGEVYDILVETSRKTLKEYLFENGKTRAEWLKEQYEKLIKERK